MTGREYNGYTNYETWNVALHIDNDQMQQGYWLARAEELIGESEPGEVLTAEEEARYALSEELREQHEDGTPEVTGVYADLLSAALSEVNWVEIAGQLIETAKEDM